MYFYSIYLSGHLFFTSLFKKKTLSISNKKMGKPEIAPVVNTTNEKSAHILSTKKPKRVRKNPNVFSSYIKKMIVKTGPDTTTSNDAVGVLNSFLTELRDDFTNQVIKFADIGRRQTIQLSDVRAATRQMFPGKLGSDALAYSAVAIKNYSDSLSESSSS